MARENVFIDTSKRIFYIHDDIDRDSMSMVCYNLLHLLNEDNQKAEEEKKFKREPIKLFINSYGGYTNDMWALVDIILNSKTPIHTYSTSHADSCAFLIFIAGHKRFITKHTKMCCHEFSGGMVGTYQDMKEAMTNYDRLWMDLVEYISTQTKITKARLAEIKEKKIDWFIYSEDSIDLGVATDIVTGF